MKCFHYYRSGMPPPPSTKFHPKAVEASSMAGAGPGQVGRLRGRQFGDRERLQAGRRPKLAGAGCDVHSPQSTNWRSSRGLVSSGPAGSGPDWRTLVKGGGVCGAPADHHPIPEFFSKKYFINNQFKTFCWIIYL